MYSNLLVSFTITNVEEWKKEEKEQLLSSNGLCFLHDSLMHLHILYICMLFIVTRNDRVSWEENYVKLIDTYHNIK